MPQNQPPTFPLIANLEAMPFVIHEPDEKTEVITVRIPKVLHTALTQQAHDVRTSLNSLCISRLITAVPECPIVPGVKRHLRQRFVEWRDEQIAKEVQAAARVAQEQKATARREQPVGANA